MVQALVKKHTHARRKPSGRKHFIANDSEMLIIRTEGQKVVYHDVLGQAVCKAGGFWPIGGLRENAVYFGRVCV